jgi:hypothetical protein
MQALLSLLEKLMVELSLVFLGLAHLLQRGVKNPLNLVLTFLKVFYPSIF